MIPIDKAVIARYKKEGMRFEILVDAEKARLVKQGKDIELDDAVASMDIFSDSAKGKKAPDEELMKAFGTNKQDEIIKQILKKGEIQLTTEQKRKMQEERTRQVLNLISRSAVDPRTHTPHPLNRLEKVFEETNYHIDPFKSAESQINEVLAVMKKILPIKMETVEIAVHAPAKHSGKICGYVHSIKYMREQWRDDGSYYAVVELPAGLKPDFEDKINKMTHGEIDLKVIERK